MVDIDCYAECRLSFRVMFCCVFMTKFQYETKFYLFELIFFCDSVDSRWFCDCALDLNINVTKSSYLYYGMSGNVRWLQNFHHNTVRLVFKWIKRRSQRKSYNWDQFLNFIQFNPLPIPKIYHSLYNA